MAKFSDYQLILDELKMSLSHVEADEFSTFASKILHAEHIFVAGKGRSGFVANSFA
ncbi:6-phospho 3-hexuloisomerase, partial [Streptococcus pseudopneumoniae]